MRAVITNFGSTGDIEPFFALALELRAHGHEPLMAFSPYYAARAQEFDLPFVPIGPDLQKTQNEINIALMSITDEAKLAARLQQLSIPIALAMPQMFEELDAVCADADVLISGPAQPMARMVYDLTDIPFVQVYYIYMGAKAREDMSNKEAAAFVNTLRRQHGLPALQHPLTSVGGPAHDGNSPDLNLYAVSPHLLAPMPGWPPHHHITGYFFLDAYASGWQPDPELLAFLDAGAPPVVIGFGSMAHADPAAMTQLILEAIDRVGCRAIIQRGWSGIGQQQLPAHVHVIDFVPHQWLFPRAACVVHHGATGTTAATFRAGVPAVFVPHAYEHPFNAWMAQQIGIAGPPVMYTQLTAERLAAAITATLETPGYREAAARVSVQIQAERGVETARLLIEELVG